LIATEGFAIETRAVRKDGSVKLAVVALILLISASAFAQDVPATVPQDQTTTPQVQTTAPQDQAAPQPYGGPSLLGRGDNPSVLHGTDLPPIRPYLGVTGAYNTNNELGYLGGTSLGPAHGVVGNYGLSGVQEWSHTELDLDFHGFYRYYVPTRDQNGFDNSLALTLKHQLSPHLSITLTENLSDVRSFYALPFGTLYGSGESGGYNPLYNTISGSGLDSTPTLASVGGARMTYQMSARLSFSAGGSGIISRQKLPQGTVGSDGWVANGDIAYRLTRYQTISAGYSFTHFSYTGQFGTTDLHALNLSYAVRIGRAWEFSLTGGVSRSEILGEVLDPFLAELLGVPAVLVKQYNVSYAPNVSVLLTRSFHHSIWSATYDHLVLGAGGLYGVSTDDHAGSLYTYSGVRHVDLNIGCGYYRYVPFQHAIAGHHALSASTGFGVHLGMGFSWIGRVDWRDYVFTNGQRRNTYYATLGIAWRPGRGPVSPW